MARRQCIDRRRFLHMAGTAGVSLAAGSAVTRLLAGDAFAAGERIRVRMGWQPTLNGARYFVATDAGIFAKNGLAVAPIKFLAGPPFFAAFQSKSIDVGFMGTPPASVGIAQGVPIKIFAVENYAPNSEALVVRKGSGITSLSDLKGKRIAAQRGTSGEYALIQGLKSVGLTLKDIHFLNLDVTVLLPAFERGEIDGGWYWEPWQGELRAAGGIQIATDGQIGVAGSIVWVARPDWLAANGDAVRRILLSLDQALPILHGRPDEVAGFLHKDTGVTTDIATAVITKEASWPTMKQTWDPAYVASINPAAIKAGNGLIRIFRKLANYQKEVRAIPAVPDFAGAIETRYVAAYLGH